MTVHLDILHVTLDHARRGHVPDNLVHTLDRIPISVWILGLAEKMVVHLLVDILRVFAPPDKVVALSKFENVYVRHASFR